MNSLILLIDKPSITPEQFLKYMESVEKHFITCNSDVEIVIGKVYGISEELTKAIESYDKVDNIRYVGVSLRSLTQMILLSVSSSSPDSDYCILHTVDNVFNRDLDLDYITGFSVTKSHDESMYSIPQILKLVCESKVNICDCVVPKRYLLECMNYLRVSEFDVFSSYWREFLLITSLLKSGVIVAIDRFNEHNEDDNILLYNVESEYTVDIYIYSGRRSLRRTLAGIFRKLSDYCSENITDISKELTIELSLAGISMISETLKNSIDHDKKNL